jgi:hypothetical protein
MRIKEITAMVAVAAALTGGAAAEAPGGVESSEARISTTNGPSGMSTGWYGVGSERGTGYFNPAVSGEYNPYPYYNIVGGESFAALFSYDLPDQNESPWNPPAALSRHRMTRSSLK